MIGNPLWLVYVLPALLHLTLDILFAGHLPVTPFGAFWRSQIVEYSEEKI